MSRVGIVVWPSANAGAIMAQNIAGVARAAAGADAPKRPFREAPMVQRLTLNVDGKLRTIEIDDPDMPLLYALRDDLGLNNPRFGCGLGQCGACTVHIDGRVARACVTPVSAVEDRKVTTLAGLGTPNHPHP